MELMDAHAQSPFSVAWVDCLATGESLGRSVLYLGDFKPQEEAHRSAQKKRSQQRNRPPELKPRVEINIPLHAPSFLLNRYTMGSFNGGYYRLKKLLPTESTVDYDSFFFSLERRKNWNRLYGRRGFLQYQFVVPCETAFHAISSVLNTAAKAGKGSFLSVLKRFGKGNDNYLSFPFDGYTLALDFKLETSLFPLLEKLDAIILQHGGRLYLAKDARMSAELFRAVGGYDENFVCGEDVELSLRLQQADAVSRFIPEAHVYHKRRATLKQFRRQVFRFGAARPLLAKAHPGNLKLTHLFPLVFTLYRYLTAIFAVLGIFYFHNSLFAMPFAPYVFYMFAVFLTALRHEGLAVALRAVQTTNTMNEGYGIGFLRNFIEVYLKSNPKGIKL